jgi:hypothetical protein
MTDSWYGRPMRWGQVNLKEDDPPTLDARFWADYWRRTRIDGITLNAGGGVAYYPTEVPLHRRARYLGDHDTFGDLVGAAKEQSLRVLGRLDLNFGHEEMYAEHPDWFLTGADGSPRQRGQAVPVARDSQFGAAARDNLYSTCWNSPFHRRFMLDVMTEILSRYDLDGFFTNGWPPIGGMPPDLSMVCHCPHCRERWSARGHDELPRKTDPSDPLWRDFVVFVQESIEEVQRLWQDHTRSLKGSATFVWNSHGTLATGLRWDRFVEIGDLLDDDTQGRTVGTPLYFSGQSAKVMHAVAKGRPVFRLFGTWQVGSPPMRQTAKPAAEETLFAAEAVANGERPWWHSLGGARALDSREVGGSLVPDGASYDPRWMDGVAEYFGWHAQHERYFRNTGSLADVGLIWSPHTIWLERWADAGSFKEAASTCAFDAINGWYLALLEARVPFDLVPVWTLPDSDLTRYKTLILPSTTCLEDETTAALTQYVSSGGGLVASFESLLCREWGEARDDYALANVFGIRRIEDPPPPLTHCYMRIGPDEKDHPLLSGLVGTEIIPGCSRLSRVEATTTSTVTTLIPTYPTGPPEKSYMDPARTDLPLVFVNEPGEGRTVYFAQDVDATFWQGRLPDHRQLLANAVSWTGGGRPVVTVEGPGLLDVTAWRQEESLTVHLVNLSTPNLYGGPVTETLPVGPQTVRLRLPEGTAARRTRLLREDGEVPFQMENGCLEVRVPGVKDHEVLAVELA